jgi:hypothetical protein
VHGTVTSVDVVSKRKNKLKKCFIIFNLLGINFPKSALTEHSFPIISYVLLN